MAQNGVLERRISADFRRISALNQDWELADGLDIAIVFFNGTKILDIWGFFCPQTVFGVSASEMMPVSTERCP